MKPPSRSFLRRLPWLRRRRTRTSPRPWQDSPAIAETWRPQDVHKTELEDDLERETALPFPPASKSTLLDRATALRVKQFLRAREDSLHIRCLCSRDKQVYLYRFNRCLWKADADPKDRETAKELWKLYIKIQMNSSDFLRALSTRAWNILWATQSLRTPSEPKVIAHLNQLAEDMRKSGHNTTFDQRLIHIETLFGRGDREKAFEEWQRGYRTKAGRTKDSYRPQYLDLGIRMYSVAGDVDRARDLLVDLFASYPDWNPRLIMYVFDAYVAIPGRPGRHKKAWVLYKRLLHLLGDKMTLEDYERCYVGFLKADSRSRAMEVLHDMLHHAPNLRDSYGYKVGPMILKGFKTLAGTVSDPDQINEAFLSGISSSSWSELQDPQFYAEWIKLLTRRGYADVAAQVVELMYEKGVAPQAQHLHPLMESWIRGTPDLVQKAETLGLQMVVERISLVRRRDAVAENELQQRLEPRRKLFLRRSIPSAVTRTFELLAKIYLEQGDKKKLDDLHSWRTKYARLPTTTATLNAELSWFLQYGYLPDVWRIFRREVLRSGTRDLDATRPDIGTFVLLWEASRMKPRTLTRSNLYRLGGHTSFPPPAIILRHTLSWLSTHRITEPPRAHAHLLARLARSRIPNRITATFCAWNDVVGALVALHVLLRSHRISPGPNAQSTHLVAKALARLALRGARTPRQRRAVDASATIQHNLDRVLRALRALLDRRLQPLRAAADRGERPALTDGEKNDVFLDALSELVRAALVRQGVPPGEVEGRIAGVKRVIGVEALRIGDKDAWEVARSMGIEVRERKL